MIISADHYSDNDILVHSYDYSTNLKVNLSIDDYESLSTSLIIEYSEVYKYFKSPKGGFILSMKKNSIIILFDYKGKDTELKN